MTGFKKNLKIFFEKNKTDCIIIFLIFFFSPLYFFNLNGYSLVDFDEAWYGEIAKNIIKTHNPFILSFNGHPYLDHPPFGFSLMALSILIFGATEFAVRLPSALFGFLSLIVLYFIGKNLFNRTVGIISVMVLTSCVWFVFRSRAGDLDTPLIFFYLLTFYFTIKLKNSSKFIYLIPVSFVATLLTKSFIGLTIIIPAVIFLFVNKIKISRSKLIISAVIFTILILPWFFQNYSYHGTDFIKKIYITGTRPTSRQSVNFMELNKSLTIIYLHNGIGKWYYAALVSAVISAFFLFKNKNIIPIYFWIGVLLYGFLTNSKTEIWHLLPIYPPISILIGFCVFKIASKLNRKNTLTHTILYSVVVAPIIFVSLWQIYFFRNQIKLFDHNIDGLAFTAKAASDYPEKLYLDSDLSVPAVATFYSNKKVNLFRLGNTTENTLPGIFKFGNKPFLLITEKWKLDLDEVKKEEYQVLSEKDGYLLVKVI